MSNELINLGIQQKFDEKVIGELTKAGDYLPALRVYGSNSNIVKEGKFPMGHFGLYFTADKIVDLGEQFDTLIVAYRPRASIMISDEQPVSYFDPNSENFTAVKEKGQAKEQGYQFGLEYLLYIPSVKQYALFFMGTPTLRRESNNVLPLVGKAATLKIKYITSKKWGGWHGCEILSCDAPFDVPPNEELKEVYESKFANPVDSDLELTSESEETRAR